MSIKRDGEYGKDYNCLDTDLVDGFPPIAEHKPGDVMTVYNSATDELESMFKMVDAGTGKWMKLF